MEFSVLLSLYYKENPAALRQALDSVFTQTVRSNDVVLVEDGKLVPELEAVVKEYESRYPELHVVRFEKNRGLGYALNDGLLECKNELVARMDTDDISKPTRFERELQIFKEHPYYGIVGTWLDEFYTTPDEIVGQRRLPETSDEIYRYGKRRCPFNHSTVMYRKSEVLRTGGYQTRYFPEDYFLWCKMLRQGTKAYNIQESLLWFRSSPETYRRRGGWKYACDETITQWNIYKLGYISLPIMMSNVAIRFTVRILPNFLRSSLYKIIRKL